MMAAIPTEIEVETRPRNMRANEILAIAMIALALLLFLCLFSYNPNDPSWNAAGESGTHNWIGAVGANVAAGLFQGIGLAAYLLPFLFLAAAWRRVRSRRINSPMMRLLGLVVLVLSAIGAGILRQHRCDPRVVVGHAPQCARAKNVEPAVADMRD